MPDFGPPIAEFTVGSTVYDVPVYIQEASTRTKKDGAGFAGYTFKDRSGTIGGVNWDQVPAEGEQGAVALVCGRVGLFREVPQLTVQSVEIVPNPDRRLIARLREPEDTARREWLLAIMEGCQADLPPGFWAIFREALGHDPFDVDGPFWTWAAGERMHHADPGGLAWHVLTMLSHVDALAPAYPKLDVDLLKLAVLCHDLGKLDAYEMGLVGARRLDLDRQVGHTACSMMRVSAAIGRLRAQGQQVAKSDEEALLHCLASHHGRREWDAIVEPVTAEAGALHALDLIDSRLRTTDQRTEPTPERLAAPATDRPARRRGPVEQASLFEE